MTSVISSNIDQIGQRGNDLEVWFISGDKYLYKGAVAHFGTMLNAPSKGKYLAREIKGVYQYEKIG